MRYNEEPTLPRFYRILEAFGIGKRELPRVVRESNISTEVAEGLSAEAVIAGMVDGRSEGIKPTFYRGYDPLELIHGVLRGSDRGLVLERNYWNDDPEVFLDRLLTPHGFDVEFRDPGTANPYSTFLEDTDPVFDVSIQDTDTGLSVTTQFEYPDTEYGAENLPALIQTVNEEILSLFGWELVMLARRPGHWDFVLGRKAQVELLQDEFGAEVPINGEALFYPRSGAFSSEPTPDKFTDTTQSIERIAVEPYETTSGTGHTIESALAKSAEQTSTDSEQSESEEPVETPETEADGERQNEEHPPEPNAEVSTESPTPEVEEPTQKSLVNRVLSVLRLA